MTPPSLQTSRGRAGWSALWPVRCTASSHCHSPRSVANSGNYRLVVCVMWAGNKSWARLPQHRDHGPWMLPRGFVPYCIVNPQLFILTLSNSFFSFIINNWESNMSFTKYMLSEKNISDFLILKEVMTKCNRHQISADICHPAKDWPQENLWTKLS